MSGRLKISETNALVRDTAERDSPLQVQAGDRANHASGENTASELLQNGVRTTFRRAEQLVSLGQGNVEALVKSGQAWTAGVQDLTKQMIATAQASFDETLTSFKALTAVKSPQDAFDVQTKLARTALEKTLAESGRFGEGAVTLFEQTLAPLVARATLVVETLSTRED